MLARLCLNRVAGTSTPRDESLSYSVPAGGTISIINLDTPSLSIHSKPYKMVYTRRKQTLKGPVYGDLPQCLSSEYQLQLLNGI